MTEIEQEKQEVQRAVEISRLTADMMQYQERENKRLWCAVVVQCVVTLVMAGCMVWGTQNIQNVANQAVAKAIMESQESMNQAMLAALNTVAEMEVTTTETTTTQTVEGDSATINNVDGEQYNGNASKGGAE